MLLFFYQSHTICNFIVFSGQPGTLRVRPAAHTLGRRSDAVITLAIQAGETVGRRYIYWKWNANIPGTKQQSKNQKCYQAGDKSRDKQKETIAAF